MKARFCRCREAAGGGYSQAGPGKETHAGWWFGEHLLTHSPQTASMSRRQTPQYERQCLSTLFPWTSGYIHLSQHIYLRHWRPGSSSPPKYACEMAWHSCAILLDE